MAAVAAKACADPRAVCLCFHGLPEDQILSQCNKFICPVMPFEIFQFLPTKQDFQHVYFIFHVYFAQGALVGPWLEPGSVAPEVAHGARAMGLTPGGGMAVDADGMERGSVPVVRKVS